MFIAIANITNAVESAKETAVVEPTKLFVGSEEWQALKSAVLAVPSKDSEINDEGRREFLGLAVYKVDADSHITVA